LPSHTAAETLQIVSQDMKLSLSRSSQVLSKIKIIINYLFDMPSHFYFIIAAKQAYLLAKMSATKTDGLKKCQFFSLSLKTTGLLSGFVALVLFGDERCVSIRN